MPEVSPQGPLHGWRVLVTRPSDQARGLCARIERAGGVPVPFPLLVIEALRDPAPARARLRRISSFDWLIFVSANAVRFAFDLEDWWPKGHRPRVAAVGRGTADALRERGVEVDLTPKAQFNSESLLEAAEFRSCAGQHFLIVRGTGGRELLADTLRQRGAAVDYAEVYQRVAPADGAEVLLPAWRRGDVDAVVLSSKDALDNLATMLGGGGVDLLQNTPVAVIGERLAAHARALGCRRLDVATEASDEGLCDAVVRLANSTRG